MLGIRCCDRFGASGTYAWFWFMNSTTTRGGQGGGFPQMKATGQRMWSSGQIDFLFVPPAPYPAQFIADLQL